MGLIDLRSEIFIKVNHTYEVLMEVRKDTRVSTSTIKVNIIAGIPPIMEIQCSDPALCFISEQKTYINPSSRLGLKAVCVNYGGSICDEPMKYKWFVYKDGTNEKLIDMHDNQGLSIGCSDVKCNQEMALTTEFFAQHQEENVYNVALEATNGPPQEATGFTSTMIRSRYLFITSKM